VILFEPQTRTLMSGDALWQDRLAIIFPEIDDQPGFGQTRQTLAMIEALQPRWVLPGHGEAFDDVATALAASRRRLASFEAQPERHARHAARALVMFHMMEHRARDEARLLDWLQHTPIFLTLARRLAGPAGPVVWAQALLAQMVDDGLLVQREAQLTLADPA
jgi:glyoxylase-like metal-dependent hydrolase (beta-lactamase superfamily II)